MNKNTLVVGIVGLAVGIIGTVLFYSVSAPRLTDNAPSGMHRMADGSMMGNQHQMGMGSMMDGMLANMRGKTGRELEKAFIEDMIPHHQGAVDMAKLLLEDETVRPELRDFAGAIITAQEGEIRQMNEWLKNY